MALIEATRPDGRASAAIAIVVAVLGLMTVAPTVVIALAVLPSPDPLTRDLWLVVSTAMATNLFVVGGVIAVRRPGNPIGPLLILSGLSATISFTGTIYASLDQAIGGHSLPGVPFVAWVSSWTFIPVVAMLAIVLPLIFPDGSLPGPRWRLALAVLLVIVALNWVQAAFGPGPLQSNDVAPRTTDSQPMISIQNPFAWPPPFDRLPEMAGGIGTIAAPVAFGLAIVGLVQKFRRSGPVERAQLKWFLFVASIAGVAFAPAVFNIGPLSDLAWVLGLSALACLPIAIGIAIVRYRLYEIDRLISRTIAYALTTGALVIVFGAIVLSLQAILAGVTQGQAIPVALSTLVAASLFQPLRRRIQTAVDRRFNRARVDAAHTVEAFAKRLRDDVDLDRLESAIEGTVVTSLQPAIVGVWLRPARSAR
jgi:hypothetical protein